MEEKRSYLINFLKKMIFFDSRTLDSGRRGREEGLQKFVAEKLMSIGANRVDVFEPDNEAIKDLPGFHPNHRYKNRPNVVAVFLGKGGGRSLVVNGHADITDPGSSELWRSNPFQCVERDGFLIGRGTADMKGGLASAILALEALRLTGVRLKGDVILMSVVDEKGGGNGTLACLQKGYRADAAVITKGTGLAIHAANHGSFSADFTVFGHSVHAAVKDQGVSAIEKAYYLIGALHRLEEQWKNTKKHPLLHSPTINVGQISGGIHASVVPGTCSVKFDVEYLPCEYDENGEALPLDREAVKRDVQMALLQACEEDEWLRHHPVSVRWYQELSAFQTDVSSAFVQEAARSVEASLGRAEISGYPAECDGIHFSRLAQMPVILFGPGRLEDAHRENEQLSIEEYLNHIRALCNLIVDWVGVEE